MNPEPIVQANLESYNRRDIDGFISYLSDDITLYNHGNSTPFLSGLSAAKTMYGELFETSPQLESTILKRIVIGNKVIDHESIVGRNGVSETVELVLVYEVRDNKIERITVIRD